MALLIGPTAMRIGHLDESQEENALQVLIFLKEELLKTSSNILCSRKGNKAYPGRADTSLSRGATPSMLYNNEKKLIKKTMTGCKNLVLLNFRAKVPLLSLFHRKDSFSLCLKQELEAYILRS